VKRAILSDIHANLEAFEAVLEDIHGQGISTIYCLGDIIGYGPNPLECLDLAMKCDLCLLGNHDQAALVDLESLSTVDQRTIFWTRQQLEDSSGNGTAKQKRWEFLDGLPRTVIEPPFTFVHGSVRNPVSEYVFPEDVHDAYKLEKIFAMIQQYCFQGHTHMAGVFTARAEFIRANQIDSAFRLDREKAMINVGSVGQPRDGDPRACYAVLEGDRVSFRRVEYPVGRTVQKIHAIAELDDFLGDRLVQGR
jgi:predicted phosphodiesterase